MGLRLLISFAVLLAAAALLSALRTVLIHGQSPLIIALLDAANAAPLLALALGLSAVFRSDLAAGLIAYGYWAASFGLALNRAAGINLTQSVGQTPAFVDGAPTALGILLVGTAPALIALALFLLICGFARSHRPQR